MNVHARTVKLSEDVNLGKLAARTPRFAGADLANLVNEAALLAACKVSTGASDDIQKATDLAERFVTVYGMSPKLRPIAFEKAQQQFLNVYNNPCRPVSPKITEEIVKK